MTDWLPGAIVVPATQDGGSMLGGGAFCTWHSFEADPHTVSYTHLDVYKRQGYYLRLLS